MMNEKVQELFRNFIDNGGTKQEFWAGRREALANMAALSKKHKKAARQADRERIEHLMERGYTHTEAKEQLRYEAYEAHDAMCGNPRKRIKRSRIPKVGLHETA